MLHNCVIIIMDAVLSLLSGSIRVMLRMALQLGVCMVHDLSTIVSTQCVQTRAEREKRTPVEDAHDPCGQLARPALSSTASTAVEPCTYTQQWSIATCWISLSNRHV